MTDEDENEDEDEDEDADQAVSTGPTNEGEPESATMPTRSYMYARALAPSMPNVTLRDQAENNLLASLLPFESRSLHRRPRARPIVCKCTRADRGRGSRPIL